MERDFLENMFPIELTSKDVRLWHSENLQRCPFSDCERIRIYPNAIEFHRDRDIHIILFDENEILASSFGYNPLIEDRWVRDLSVFNWSFVEPINLSANPLPLN